MNLKLRLTILSFLQFFVWGAWLITMANFWFGTKHWDGTQFGAVFGTMGIASIFMPTITGIIADRWVNAENILDFTDSLWCSSFYLASYRDTKLIFLNHVGRNVFLYANDCINEFYFLHNIEK
jgi:NHS family xanthosine MFS transporter